MTSPYLQRPKRSLNQALIDTGRARAELGSGDSNVRAKAMRGRSGGPNRFSLNRIALAFAIALGLLAGTTFMAFRSDLQAPVLLADPEVLNDISPAAGPPSNTDPNRSATDIEDWGDAPSLDLKSEGGAAAD